MHRDLKPANVILTPSGHAKLLDLGIAQLTRTEPVGAAGTTDSFAKLAVGTPGDMAPEQYFSAAVDERSDLFSLGVVLFEQLTGTRPFPGDTWMAFALATTQGVAPRVNVLRPDVPEALADLIASLLEREPSRRPRSALDVQAALSAIDRSFGSADTLETPKARPSNRRLTFALVGMLALAVLVGIWSILQRREPTWPPGPILILPALNLSGNDELTPIANLFSSVLAANLSATRGITVVSPAAAPAFRTPSRDPRAAARTVGAAYALDLDLTQASGGITVSSTLNWVKSTEPLWTSTDSGAPVDVLRKSTRSGVHPNRARRVNGTTPRAGRPGPDARDAHR